MTGECEECRRKRLAPGQPGGSGGATRVLAVKPEARGFSREPGAPNHRLSGLSSGHAFQRVQVNRPGPVLRPSALNAESMDSRAFDLKRLTVPCARVAGGGSAPGAADAGLAPATPPAPEPAAPAPAPASAAPTAPATAPAAAPPAAAPAAPALSWTHVLTHRYDALWFFCGEHPSGFSITAHLQAAGAGNPAALRWRVTQGADKAEFDGAPSGADVTVKSKAGSARANDVEIEVAEGTGPTARSYLGRLTVRKPDRLIARAITDHAACPPWAACGACPAYWTELGYRIVDNVSGTIVGATVNENFPSAKVNDQANNWVNPAAFATVPFWENTNGTFVDNWFVSCGNPAPVAPGTPNAGQAVDHMAHEFYVGSKTPARGCRVQTHTAQRNLGMARHTNIVTPAP